MCKSNILLLYFYNKPLCRNNTGREIALILKEMLEDKEYPHSHELLVMHCCDVSNFNYIEKCIQRGSPKYVVAFGEMCFTKKKDWTYQFEHKRDEETNNIFTNGNIKYNSWDCCSPCIKTRNFLCKQSSIYDFQWEFVHVKKCINKNEMERIATILMEKIAPAITS